MNTANCTTGLFTDDLLVFNPSLTCNQSIAGYVVLFLVVIILRTVLAGLHCRAWILRQAYRRKKTGVMYKRHLPIVPVVSSLDALAHILVFVLGALNIANSQNGLSLFFLGIIIAATHILHGLWSYKMIRLGRKLIPLNRAYANIINDDAARHLSQLDGNIMALFVALLVTATACVINLILCWLAFPEQLLAFRVAMGILAVNQVFAQTVLVYQYERLIIVTKSVHSDLQKNMIGLVSNGDQLEKAVRHMRVQQLAMSLGFFTNFPVTLGVAVGYLQFYWYLFGLILLIDVMGFFQFYRAQNQRKMNSTDNPKLPEQKKSPTNVVVKIGDLVVPATEPLPTSTSSNPAKV